MADPDSPGGLRGSTEVTVVASDEQDVLAVDAERWARLAADVLRSEGSQGELTLTFVDRAEITLLNREHMGEEGPTDVLSFPLDAFEVGSDPSVGPVLLGDVVICPEIAAEAAPDHAGSLDDELALLTVHGVLHVLGHDHVEDEETRRMRRRELELLTAHHWRGPPPARFVQEQGP